jgi:predicted RNase H-like nuclease (RuvC/YqgF family)
VTPDTQPSVKAEIIFPQEVWASRPISVRVRWIIGIMQELEQELANKQAEIDRLKLELEDARTCRATEQRTPTKSSKT